MNTAVLSHDGAYRYVLWRQLPQRQLLQADLGTVMFLMLNPSTADADQDDQTIRKVVGFAAAWGYSKVVVANLYALRSTDPRGLVGHPDPVGPGNDAAIRECAKAASRIVAAWGNGPGPLLHLTERAQHVRTLFDQPLFCLDTTDSGAPRHPLYLPGGLEPRPFFIRS
jgi:hypothetical protein